MLISTLAVLLGAATSTADAPAAVPPAVQERLVLTLEAYRNAVVLYEPVTLVYRVNNPTSDAITSSVSLSGIEFVVTGPNEKKATHRPGGILGHAILAPVRHEPGSVIFDESDLGWRGEQGPFPVVGVYEVRARVYAGGQPTPVYLESNPVRIEVRQPSQKDLEAVPSVGSEADFKRLLREGASAYCRERGRTTCLEQLALVVEQHQDSAYSPAITRTLGDAFSSVNPGDQSTYDRAVRLYQQFLDKWPDHPNAPSVMYCLAMTLDKAGRSGEVSDVISEFQRRFPEQKEKAIFLRTNLRSGQAVAPTP